MLNAQSRFKDMQLQLILGHKLKGDELIVDLSKLPHLL